MIQWRNLNLDPEIYMDTLGRDAIGNGMGITQAMAKIKQAAPWLRFGYFNPYVGSRG